MNATGISIERNSQGIAQYVRIDLKKYGVQLKDFFISNGIEVEPQYDPAFVEKIRRSEQQPSVTVAIDDLWK